MHYHIRVFCIGRDGTEVYAGSSEAAVRRYYELQVGKEDAAEDLKNNFSELSNAEIMKRRTDPETGKRFTYYKLAESATEWPTQICTGYN